MRILLTNDDGIDSVGLHVLARAMRRHGEVVIVAPDAEYSGASAAIGALYKMQPEVHRREVDGIDEAWAVNGAPALCVMFARMGAFGGPFDLIVSGINPGANVGRSVYHSGTIGAAVTGRIAGIHGIAVSQAVESWGVEGQTWDDVVELQKWDTAAHVADLAVEGFLASPPAEPAVLNINVPNLEIADLKGWRRTEIATAPPRSVATATLVPRHGHLDAYDVKMQWGEAGELPIETDSGAVMAGEVSLSWLSGVTSMAPAGIDATEAAVAAIFS